MERVPGARVLIVSDHGFGGAGDTALRLNRWLAENGWLAWQPTGRRSRWAGALRSAALAAIPEQWQAACFRVAGGRLANAVESGVRFGGIDWRRTQAFSEELNYAPSIWLNVAGREPGGQVPASEYERTCARLAEQLLGWEDPIHGTKVVRRVRHRDEVYDGACVESAPDLILDLETPGGYSYVCLPSYGQAGAAVERMSGSALSAGKLSGMSGSHRPDGLFILAGPGVAPGHLCGAAMADMAPTVLALCGVGVPSGWDGRPLRCLSGAPAAAAAVDEPMTAESVYDDEQEERLRRRLEDLGYLA